MDPLKRLTSILRDNTGMLAEATFEHGLKTWVYPNRRVGRPKYQWAEKALEELQKNEEEYACLVDGQNQFRGILSKEGLEASENLEKAFVQVKLSAKMPK